MATKKQKSKRWLFTIYYSQSKPHSHWQDVIKYMGKGTFLGTGSCRSGSDISFEFLTKTTALNAKKRLQKSKLAGVQEIEIVEE